MYTHLWNDIHVVSGDRTSPEVIMSSAKSFGLMPCSSWRWKSMPDFRNNSIESGEYMSSLCTRQPSLSSMEPQHALDTEAKVELPCTWLRWHVPLRVRERDANLDDLEQVDVTAHRLVVVLRRRLPLPYRARNDAGEFGVLRGG